MNNYTIDVYWQYDLVARITVIGSSVSVENFERNPVMLPFGINTNPTMKDLQNFYESRCFPRDRVNCNSILKRLDIPFYEPELICRRLHGVDNDDYMWLNFSDEEQVTYDDVRLRK